MVDKISPETIWELSYGLKIGLVDRDRYLICSGDKKWVIYFILSGKVEISLYCIHERVMIDTLYKGCSIGTYSCLSGIPVEMTALAITHVSYYYLEFSYI